MSSEILFTRKKTPPKKLKKFIEQYNLKKSYDDKLCSIYENDSMLVSVSKFVLSITLYDKKDYKLRRKIYDFFTVDYYDRNKKY